jgi:hypothetical protein
VLVATRRSALSLVEVMVGVIIFAVLFVPAYTLFVQSKNTAFKSKLAYMGVHAAREEIEDLRILARVHGDRMKSLEHDWKPLEGNAMDRVKDVSANDPPPRDLDYPAEYRRIWTKVEIKESRDPYIFPAVLHVRWQEHGEKFGAGSEREKPGFSRFDFYLVRARRGF